MGVRDMGQKQIWPARRTAQGPVCRSGRHEEKNERKSGQRTIRTMESFSELVYFVLVLWKVVKRI